MTPEHIRSEIELMRVQAGKQRREILTLQRAGISTAAAEVLLQRMLDKIDALCAERDRLKLEQSGHKGKVLGRRRQ
jgi:hypothetical protein